MLTRQITKIISQWQCEGKSRKDIEQMLRTSFIETERAILFEEYHKEPCMSILFQWQIVILGKDYEVKDSWVYMLNKIKAKDYGKTEEQLPAQ